MGTGNVTALASSTQSYISSLSIDVTVLVVIFVLMFIYGLRYGKYSIVSLILSSYVAFVLFANFPFRESVSLDFGMLLNKFNIAETLFIIVIILLVHMVTKDIIDEDYSSRKIRRWVDVGVLSLSFSIFFMTILYMTDVAIKPEIGTLFDLIFTNAKYFFWLLVLPFVGIFIATR